MPSEFFGVEPGDPVGTFIFLTVSGYTFYFAVAGLFFLVFFVWGRKRFNPDYKPNWRENRSAMKWTFYSVIGNAVLTAPIHVAIATGQSKVYYDVGDHGWDYFAISIVVLFVMTETLVYWAHRILHMGKIWDWLHKYHHRFNRPTPWSSISFHPLDSFAQGVPHHLAVFLIPMHIDVYFVSLTLLTAWAVSIHDRVSIVRVGALNYAGHHTMHHYFDDYNYGQYTTFWDRLMGTYRNPRDEAHWPPKNVDDAAYAPNS